VPRRRRETERQVQALFDSPPAGRAELEYRLDRMDAAAARRALVDRLERADVARGRLELVEAALALLGAGDETERLQAIVLDDGRPLEVRATALRAFGPDPETFADVLENVGPAVALALVGDTVREGLLGSEPDEVGGLVGTFLAGTGCEPDDRDLALAALEIVERHRLAAGLSAARVYDEALDEPLHPALVEAILEAVIEEAEPAGAALLERMRDVEEDPGMRRVWQKALLRCRSAGIDTGRRPAAVEGFALVSHCDGQGAFVMIGAFENDDGTLTAADLCIRAASDVRDGFVAPRLPPGELRAFADQLDGDGGLHLVRTRLEEAATLAAEGVRRTLATGRAIPRDAADAVRLFERLRGAEAPLPHVAPAARPTLRRVRALLRRSEYGSWFFDVGDLAGAGVVGTGAEKPAKAWFAAAAAALDTPETRARVTAMAEHMACWHHWNREPDEAALCAALARTAAEDFGRSPLVRAMLEASIAKGAAAAMAATAARPAVLALGDETLRHRLKAELFADVRHPTARELGRLDLTEAAWVLLDVMLGSLPGERRPREDDHLALAHRLGGVVVGQVLGEPRRRAESARAACVAHVREATGLSVEAARAFADEALQALHGFVRGICGRCPVACLRHPDADYSDTFFADGHPAFGGPDDEPPRAGLEDLHPPRRVRRPRPTRS
jgi:hypothetical protein